MVDIGERAPQFSLYDTEKQLRSLGDFEGEPVVLLFFPCAFSDVCTDEMNQMQKMIQDINSLDAQVIGISTDSVHTLAEFKKKYGYDFPFLSDYNKDVSRAYGVLDNNFTYGMHGVSRRAVFVLNAEGYIVYEEIMDDQSILPSFEGIQASLKKIKHLV